MNKYIEIIKARHPDIVINKLCFNNEGQNNDIVIVNDHIIFKFPKYPSGVIKLEKEYNILNQLKKHMTLSIPDPKYSNFDFIHTKQTYIGYEIIQGVSFYKDVFLKAKNKNYIAEQLAVFLKELHSIPYKEWKSNDLLTISDISEYVELFNNIQEKIFPLIKEESKKSITKDFDDFFNCSHNYTPAIIHGDFGPSNIIFDLEKEVINGVIDFNEISIGDPAIDIASLMGPFGYGKEFVESFEPVYTEISTLFERAKFYSSTYALQAALFGLKFNDKKAFNDGIRQYL